MTTKSDPAPDRREDEAVTVADAIIAELKDRRGIGDEIESCDEDVYEEIRRAIVGYVRRPSPSPDMERVREAFVHHFLRWKLPESVCADLCATDENYAYPRSGTNLLSATEAGLLFDEVVAPALASLPQERAEGVAVKPSTRLTNIYDGMLEHAEEECDRLKKALKLIAQRAQSAEDEEAFGWIYHYANKVLDEETALATPPSSGLDRETGRTFAVGDRVTKVKGASWTGRVVGTYSTSFTPEGYAVESENEPGSVQIYPAAAIRALTEAEGR